MLGWLGVLYLTRRSRREPEHASVSVTIVTEAKWDFGTALWAGLVIGGIISLCVSGVPGQHGMSPDDWWQRWWVMRTWIIVAVSVVVCLAAEWDYGRARVHHHYPDSGFDT